MIIIKLHLNWSTQHFLQEVNWIVSFPFIHSLSSLLQNINFKQISRSSFVQLFLKGSYKFYQAPAPKYNGFYFIQFIKIKIIFMSSPTRRRPSNSPIRHLDERSPQVSRKLHTIMEESLFENRSKGYMSENSSLVIQNQVLNQKMRNYAHESHQCYLDNSRLRQQNEILKQKNYVSVNIEQDRLQRQLILKDAELQKLNNDMNVLKNHYERDLEQARVENESLRHQVVLLERKNYADVAEVKDKYNAMVVQDSTLTRKAYSDDLKKVVIALESTKALLSEKQLQLNHLTSLSQKFSKQYSLNLQQLISENNVLRNKILATQINKNNQVREAETKKELEKSRTNGILNFCKENNAFIEKQVKKLAQELLEKNISIEGFTKEILKQKKSQEQSEKRYEDKIQRLEESCESKIRDMEQFMKKAEKHQKEQIGDMKKKEMDLIQMIGKLEHEKDTMYRQLQHTQSLLQQKMNELEESKNNLAQLHEEHARQINKVMTDSRVKRRSMKNLSSSISSLRQLSVEGGSTTKKLLRQNSLVQNQEQSSNKGLHIVPEQITNSQLVQGDEDVDMRELVIHYEEKIQELKRHSELEQTLSKQKVYKLNQSLREKQQQVLELLERFSPLMQFKLNPTSLESERKEKIEKHYKADIDLLSVMLDKYQIVALKK